jgi:hypothetical protein
MELTGRDAFTRVILCRGPGHVESEMLSGNVGGESLDEVLDRHGQFDRAREVKSSLHGGFGMGLKEYKISLVRNILDEVKPIAHNLSLWVESMNLYFAQLLHI